MKLLIRSAVLGLVLAAPTNAMDPMKCDDASMTKIQAEMDAMSDPAMKANKDMAMKHMEMAKTAMKENKMDDCSMQLGMASMSMTMKCDEASMVKMQTEMDAMTDPAMKAKKEMAMKEMDMAKMVIKDSKTDECMMRMDEAMNSMHSKK